MVFREDISGPFEGGRLAGEAASEKQNPRCLRRQNTWLRCWVGDGAVQRYACITDLSSGGARILTANPPPRGTSLQVVVPQERACYEANVVWCTVGFAGRGGVMGVQFLRRLPLPSMMQNPQPS